ncbi:MAG: HNH endonuclease signature motif containing protein [Colwellia sp.]|jgi:hypothetical protein
MIKHEAEFTRYLTDERKLTSGSASNYLTYIREVPKRLFIEINPDNINDQTINSIIDKLKAFDIKWGNTQAALKSYSDFIKSHTYNESLSINSSISSGIIIRWSESIEYIDIDPNNLKSLNELDSSREYWEEEDCWVNYNLQSTINLLENGNIELTIEYKENNNTHIPTDSVSWGRSIILFEKGKDIGTVIWTDTYEPKDNGKRYWETNKISLKNPEHKVTTTRTKRNQSKFRNELLACENCCALSGESTSETIEAAHIIPSKDGGPEVAANGILLRADIHLLYDSGKFKINPLGQVVEIDTRNISNEYHQLLKGKKLSNRTLIRVKQALAYQWHSNKD